MAEILVHAYLDTASYSRQFRDEYGSPPTLFSKIHHLRSIVQVTVNKSALFKLEPEYSEFGRVQVLDAESGRRYLLRSHGAVSIEAAKRDGVLFDATKYLRSEVILLVYSFHEEGMDLSIAGTRQRTQRKRLEASGKATFVGTWPLTDGPTPFNQGENDAFRELGDLPDEEEGEGKGR